MISIIVVILICVFTIWYMKNQKRKDTIKEFQKTSLQTCIHTKIDCEECMSQNKCGCKDENCIL